MRTIVCCVQKGRLNIKTDILKLKGWEEICYPQINPMKAGMAKLICDKVDYRVKNTVSVRDHSIMTRGQLINMT